MVTILMMSAKMATPGFLKTKVFENRGNDVVIAVHDVSSRSLSRNSNYIVDLVMWPNFGNCNISMREVIITSILLWIWPEKPLDLDGWSWFKFNNFGLPVIPELKHYTSMAKGFKLKVRNFCWLIPTFVEVTGGTGWRGLFALILNRVKLLNQTTVLKSFLWINDLMT